MTLNVSAGPSGTKRALPSLDANSFIVWDWQLMNNGAAPAYGGAPALPFKSTGAQVCDLSASFNNGSGGVRVVSQGPFGRAADFYASGASLGGLASAGAPPNPGANQDLTGEAYFFLRDVPVNHGVILSKAWDANAWVAPFNAFEIAFTGSGGNWECGITDTANTATEIAVQMSGRNALTFGQYHHVAHVIDGAAKLGRVYLDGIQVATYAFGTGIAYASAHPGPWMVAGNVVNSNDSANLIFNRVAISNVARSAAYILAAAQGYLGI